MNESNIIDESFSEGTLAASQPLTIPSLEAAIRCELEKSQTDHQLRLEGEARLPAHECQDLPYSPSQEPQVRLKPLHLDGPFLREVALSDWQINEIKRPD